MVGPVGIPGTLILLLLKIVLMVPHPGLLILPYIGLDSSNNIDSRINITTFLKVKLKKVVMFIRLSLI